MKRSTNLRHVLLGCVLSNVVIGAAGVAMLGQAAPVVSVAAVAAPKIAMPEAVTPTTIAAPATTAAPLAPASSAPKTSSTPLAHTTRPSRSRAAVATDNVTGIASSAAPQSPARVAPGAGTYPVTFSGNASVDGRPQPVPSIGFIRLTQSGANIEQSSPDAPGDVVLLQHFVDSKSDLVSFQMTANNTTKTFVPSSLATYLQYNSPEGTGWNWSATSTDGKTSVSATGVVGATSTTTIDGQSIPTVLLTTTLTLSGDITGTAKLMTWASPEYRLPVVQRQIINASAKVSWGYAAKLVSDVTTTFSRLAPN